MDPPDVSRVGLPPASDGRFGTGRRHPFQGTRFVVFGGGCVRYDHHFASGVPASLSLRADDAFSFVPRADVVAAVRDEFHQTLCGADAPPCEDPS